MSLAAVALAVAFVPAAQAQQGEDETDIAHKLRGVVVSVDLDAGTVDVATGKRCMGRGRHGGPRDESADEDAGVSQRRGRRRGRGRGRGRGHHREAQILTILTDDETRIRRNGEPATLADLEEGDRVKVVILTDDETTFREALSEAAYAISARAKPQREDDDADENDESEDEGPEDEGPEFDGPETP